MGFIKDAIKSFDGTPEAKKEMEVQLDNMTALAKAKADYFELKLTDDLSNAGTGNRKDIPVKFIIDYTRQTHAYGSTSVDAVVSTITDAISDFITGGKDNVLKGVSSLLTKAVRILFASKEGGEDETHFTAVFAEGRALVRLDLMAWKRYTMIKSLSESAEQISAFVMSKSTIDATVLDYNSFIQLYQKNLYEPASTYSPKEITEQLDEIDLVYQKFLSHQKSQKAEEKTGRIAPPRFPKPTKEELENAQFAIKKAELLLNESLAI